MDGKIIKYTVIFLFICFNASAIEFNGKFIQGHFILGKTDPGSKIIIDKKEIKVSNLVQYYNTEVVLNILEKRVFIMIEDT